MGDAVQSSGQSSGQAGGQSAADQEAAHAETKAVIAAAFDNSADSYEQLGVEFFAPLGAELVRRVAPQPGERVLDLGCGRGHCLFPAAEAVGETGSVVGTDLSTRMVELCGAEVARRGLTQVRVELGDASAPDFAAGSFDVVTAGMVMFFVPEPRKTLPRVAALLRPGGRYAMSSFGPSDPKFDETMGILYKHRIGPPWEPNPDKPFDTHETMTGMLTDAGFVDVAITELQHDIVFADPDGYWAWVGSHGGRIMIDQVLPEHLPAAQADVYAMWEPHREADGSLIHRSRARFTTARVPG
ncbi:MAG TPA: methyltransferase domain-containing protein [Sporichthya sp.]|nr:methyltransferase domain-containing protein [Sporichthya sp.]